MLGLDQFTPHEHTHGGPCGTGCERVGRVWLFVFAIALHNLPEGMAIGVAFSQGDMDSLRRLNGNPDAACAVDACTRPWRFTWVPPVFVSWTNL